MGLGLTMGLGLFELCVGTFRVMGLGYGVRFWDL